jgi:hypothetical protein
MPVRKLSKPIMNISTFQSQLLSNHPPTLASASMKGRWENWQPVSRHRESWNRCWCDHWKKQNTRSSSAHAA